MEAPETEGPRARPGTRAQAPVVAAVALGGAAGAAARYAAGLGWPTPAGTFPWTILCVNVAGCALIGVLMVIVTEVRTAHLLVRPFLGTGVLGGFTTFSTYAVDVRDLLDGGHAAAGVACLVVTPVAALTAVWTAAAATRSVLVRRHP
ncbi:fluoride efflux transporter FluC [Streptomyces pilosus]|uniref:fluoride efflux transporter FluC n=1 Tax=Streptomyces pilosus TaxID=28893 RepID=UPI0036F98403